MNLELKGVLCNLGNQYRQGSSSIFDGTATFISFIYLICLFIIFVGLSVTCDKCSYYPLYYLILSL